MNPQDFESAAAGVRRALSMASQGLVEREALVELVALAAVAGEHLLVIGPPGTAKSEAVRRVAKTLGGHYFEYLLGRFTEPSELFGPIDLRKLREGRVETETAGMLPEAEIAFLDEVFLGSTAILNTLLGLLNERKFRRGHTQMDCPLRVCVGASNGLPEEPSLAAFADRFLLRAFLDPVAAPRLEELLEQGWGLLAAPVEAVANVRQLDELARASRTMKLDAVRPMLAHAVRQLRASAIDLSDRRIVKVQRLIAAAASLAGRTEPTQADLWPIVFALPTRELQGKARDLLRDLLEPSQNASLPAAAEEASLGPLARAERLGTAGIALLEHKPANPEELPAWRLKLESVGRAIDASIPVERRPPRLAELRARLLTELEPSA